MGILLGIGYYPTRPKISINLAISFNSNRTRIKSSISSQKLGQVEIWIVQ